jgi:hypothetical protein
MLKIEYQEWRFAQFFILGFILGGLIASARVDARKSVSICKKAVAVAIRF